ncbi:UNVERIFIED_CONTAM: hypothetical protein HDU68_008337 [Siphonaria sp. JEL0065]|nr:hypothetical protein HDU68_008337 [Siphonaria sp. JEL0065]
MSDMLDSDVESSPTGMSSVFVRPGCNDARKSVFSPPVRANKADVANNSSESLERLRAAGRGVSRGGAYTRESGEGSEVVWGMQWTTAHKEPEECEEHTIDDGNTAALTDDGKDESARAASDDGGSNTKRTGTASLVHRLFGKKS